MEQSVARRVNMAGELQSIFIGQYRSGYISNGGFSEARRDGYHGLITLLFHFSPR